MKVLSLTQPWATLVAIGAKTIETRSWATRYRGPLAIHAAKGFPAWAKDYCEDVEFEDALTLAYPGLSIEAIIKALPLGQIIATCTLDDCFQFTRESVAAIGEPERSFGDYDLGRYGFRLGNVRKLDTPIPARGSLGLWNYEGEL
jgi:hypothetical protein